VPDSDIAFCQDSYEIAGSKYQSQGSLHLAKPSIRIALYLIRKRLMLRHDQVAMEERTQIDRQKFARDMTHSYPVAHR
jgi:hypothetical protein